MSRRGHAYTKAVKIIVRVGPLGSIVCHSEEQAFALARREAATSGTSVTVSITRGEKVSEHTVRPH